jgi:intein/homing endonuclease
MIDEIGLFEIFGEMMREGRPALFKFDPVKQKLVMQQQFFAWGCVCAGTKVYANDGSVVNIEDLKQEQGIIGYDGEGASKEPILWMKPPAKKECYRITTTGGDFIECSHDHPLMKSSHLERNGKSKIMTFHKAEDIKVGDQLIMIGDVDVFGNERVEDARLLGLMIGDGNYSLNSTPQLSVADKEIRDYVFGKYNCKVYKTKETKAGGVHESIGITGFVDTLRHHGRHGQSKLKKTLPKNIAEFDRYSLCELLGGYFDADGNVGISKGYVRIVLTSASEELLK